jgi:hypothetical protein
VSITTLVVGALCAIPNLPAAAPAAIVNPVWEAFFKNCLRDDVFMPVSFSG